jgi:hypothetical protein
MVWPTGSLCDSRLVVPVSAGGRLVAGTVGRRFARGHGQALA